MTFWQENYAFIKDVYDSRASKLCEVMTKTDKAIADVLADKIYTSAEFKKVKEIFMVRIFIFIFNNKNLVLYWLLVMIIFVRVAADYD